MAENEPENTENDLKDANEVESTENMAKKTIKNRAQVYNPRTDRWVKIDTKKGGIVNQKKSPGPYKNVKKHRKRTK
jgi:hypothetical protein